MNWEPFSLPTFADPGMELLIVSVELVVPEPEEVPDDAVPVFAGAGAEAAGEVGCELPPVRAAAALAFG